MLIPKNGKRVFPFFLFLGHGSRTICLNFEALDRMGQLLRR
jgi:hypothetical protein